MDIVLIILGLVFLVFGGELLVRGSVAIAYGLNLSTLLVGIVIVGFGASSPELLVSVTAALGGNTDIAIGNVIGSNIANVFLILGLAAIFQSIDCRSNIVMRDALFVLAASGVIILFSFYGTISRLAGVGLVALLTAYLSYSYFAERNRADQSQPVQKQAGVKTSGGLLFPAVMCLAGFAALMFGAKWLVAGAVAVAMKLGVPQSVIGLTLVAVGTSLPELATAVVAAYRKEVDIVIGNILGSNLFNILGILGLTAILSPLEFKGEIAEFDSWVMLAGAVLLFAVIALFRSIRPVTGIIFLTSYAAYIVWVYFRTLV